MNEFRFYWQGGRAWSIAPDLKSGVPKDTVGSNPTPVACLLNPNR